MLTNTIKKKVKKFFKLCQIEWVRPHINVLISSDEGGRGPEFIRMVESEGPRVHQP